MAEVPGQARCMQSTLVFWSASRLDLIIVLSTMITGLASVSHHASGVVMGSSSRLMPRYECCCDNCPRRPCYICRNVDYACNCGSCSCYADSHQQQIQPLNTESEDLKQLVPLHRVRHHRHRSRPYKFMQSDLNGVTSPSEVNGMFII